jgi:hypothetical protein
LDERAAALMKAVEYFRNPSKDTPRKQEQQTVGQEAVGNRQPEPIANSS